MWVEVAPARAPIEPVELQVVESATLTTFGKGRLRVAWPQPTRFVSGAVYDAEGKLVPRSQRIGGLLSDHALSADPPDLPPWDGHTTDLPGTWLYAGTWFNHFGHFLTETVTTLWPQGRVDGVVAHPFWFGREVLPWQRAMLELLGRPGPTVVGPERLRVERLLVPTRPYLPNGYALPEAVQVWRRMAAAAGAPEHRGPARIYFSRSAHHRALAQADTPSARSAANETDVDALFRSRGYQVVQAEELDLSDQIRVVADAEVIAGVSGSALHLSVFAPPGIPVVEVGDVRARPHPVRTQEVLTQACEQRLGFLRFTGATSRHDVPDLARRLEAMGL